MDEATLIEKLLKIEAIFAGAATEGERTSAEHARQRILQRLAELLPEYFRDAPKIIRFYSSISKYPFSAAIRSPR
jgi:hypothetical protein